MNEPDDYVILRFEEIERRVIDSFVRPRITQKTVDTAKGVWTLYVHTGLGGNLNTTIYREKSGWRVSIQLDDGTHDQHTFVDMDDVVRMFDHPQLLMV